MTVQKAPLFGPPPEEVPLPESPLVMVIAQVRFPPILGVQDPHFIARFQESIRQSYPVLHQERVPSLTMGPDGVKAMQEFGAWRFASSDDKWRVSLTPEFVALATVAYESRNDFIIRMEQLLNAAQEHLGPSSAERVGMRYISHVIGEPLKDIENLIRPELLGLASTDLFYHTHNALADAQLDAPEENARLLLRWGQLSANSTHDPSAVSPISERRWVLDFDMFSKRAALYDVPSLKDNLETFAKRLYSVFRWSVTDNFIRTYGGKL